MNAPHQHGGFQKQRGLQLPGKVRRLQEISPLDQRVETSVLGSLAWSWPCLLCVGKLLDLSAAADATSTLAINGQRRHKCTHALTYLWPAQLEQATTCLHVACLKTAELTLSKWRVPCVPAHTQHKSRPPDQSPSLFASPALCLQATQPSLRLYSTTEAQHACRACTDTAQRTLWIKATHSDPCWYPSAKCVSSKSMAGPNTSADMLGGILLGV